jgi:hypothetical protein
MNHDGTTVSPGEQALHASVPIRHKDDDGGYT